MSNNLFEALHQIATDKGIPRDEIERIVESAILSAYKKEFGIIEGAQVVFNRDDNTVKVRSKKIVVRKPVNRAEEIAYDDAVKIDPEINLGDDIIDEDDPLKSFGRIAAQTAKQVIIQKLKEAEKNIIFMEFKDKEGELINGYLQRKFRDAIYVDLGRTEGVLPAREQSSLEHYKTGDRIKALILAVQNNSRGPSVILSRTHPKFIEKLFEMEIPEIYDDIVKIQNVVREPGMRTKVAVMSERDDVDAVGACVGMKGVRIQSIVRELEGEKIDVVEYSGERKMMASNSLTPARVKDVVETSEGGVIAVVENDQYKLAVGRGGHNARLASRLCGFDINIKSEEQYDVFLNSAESRAIIEKLFARQEEEETPLEELELETRVIKLLENGGIFSVEDLVEKSFDELMEIEGIGEKTAKKIMDVIEESVDFEEDDSDDEESVDSGEEFEEEGDLKKESSD